ncbi:MAG: hypothetical protein LUD02_15540 [Tannerellaceae bacterium]|nr:hypothetical protein [Tannerellaceae bacterium]MCD8265384.1 hypothetical protein [Tannerellaceae bacterium]
MIQKANVEKIRLYVSGEDLFEIHNVPGGYDPENNGYFNNYPFTRNFSIGVNVTF